MTNLNLSDALFWPFCPILEDCLDKIDLNSGFCDHRRGCCFLLMLKLMEWGGAGPGTEKVDTAEALRLQESISKSCIRKEAKRIMQFFQRNGGPLR
jgi:hypothetical protein